MKESIKHYLVLIGLAMFVIACLAIAIGKKVAMVNLILGIFLG